jgi:hypothetical protein
MGRKLKIIDPDLLMANLAGIIDTLQDRRLVEVRPMKMVEEVYARPGVRPLYKKEVMGAVAASIKEIDLDDYANTDSQHSTNRASKIAGVVIDKE